jgi:hypothetical protein
MMGEKEPPQRAILSRHTHVSNGFVAIKQAVTKQ